MILDKLLDLLYNRRNTKEEDMDGIDSYFEMKFSGKGDLNDE